MTDEDKLFKDLSKLIKKAKALFFQQTNATGILLYWYIGNRLNKEILKSQRGQYGKRIVENISTHLTALHGSGYGKRNLWRMVQFASCYPDKEIVSSAMTQLSWTHIVYILTIDDKIKRDFYVEMCRIERWTIRDLMI